MVLGEGATLVGRVVDAEGRAVVKADVQAYADSVGHDLATDESGAFRVEHLPASTVHVWVRAPGFLDAELEFAAVTEATPVVVTMRHGGVLRGLVHYPDGAPARDLKIQIAEHRQDSTLRPSLTSAFEERLHAGRYTVVVKRGDTTLATREAEVREGEETPVDISVSR
jgi:hypothetical protein